MYQLINNSTNILRTTDNAIIPADNGNPDYQNYIYWLSEGNTVTPATVNTFQNAISNGYDTGLGWSMPLDDSSRNLITSAATLITSASYGDTIDGTSAILLSEASSSVHMVSNLINSWYIF